MENLTNVFIAKYPFECDEFICDERKREIDDCSNQTIKQEKFYVWKLLEKALRKTLNIDIKDVEFQKLPSGKWVCDKCFFSISHSHDIVCVAISNSLVGVDIEMIDEKRNLDKMIEKSINENEACNSINEFFVLWTIKEAFFKYQGQKHFDPKTIDTTKLNNFCSKYINIFSDRFVLSIVGDNLKDVKINYE